MLLMFRYLSYIITFSSRKTLSKVKTREAKTCNYVKNSKNEARLVVRHFNVIGMN